MIALILALPDPGVLSASHQGERPTMEQTELIVLATPRSGDPYYRAHYDSIIEFQRQFAEQIVASGDRVLILAERGQVNHFAGLGPNAKVSIAPQLDIWIRDYGTSNSEQPVMFRYTAEGQGGGRQGQFDSDAVQERLASAISATEARFRSTDWLNDGGNWVDDGAGRVVLSRKFLRDNEQSERAARRALIQTYGLEAVAFIEADEQGGLEHADGVVAFLEPRLLVTNDYPDDPDYAAQLLDDLQRGLPDTEIHRIVTAYDGSVIMDERFGSACGLYTNMLVTPERIYLPQFGIDQDQIALEQIRELTEKTVIPIPSGQVCGMGGGVRCLSWQLRGTMASGLWDQPIAQAPN
ncbi:MAG: agmatine deiminase family protein [Pseudomonadota bacterium]